jgi:hypothetical protein
VNRLANRRLRLTMLAGALSLLTALTPAAGGAGGGFSGASPASASPTAGAAAGGQFYGVFAAPALRASEYDGMARIGARTVRMQLSWGWVEPNRGQRNWQLFDSQVRGAAQAGVGVLPVLIGVPNWISGSNTTPPVRSEEERSQYRRFLDDAVERYGPNGTFWLLNPTLPKIPIRTWQVGNEPNLPYFFGGKVSVRRFRRLLKVSATALRSADPGARIVTGGIFRYRTVRGSLGLKKFLSRMYRAGGVRRWFDVLAVHAYAARPKGVVGGLRVARKIMRRSRDGRTPIWLTEFGWTVGGVGWRTTHWRATKRQQAKRLKRTYRLVRGTRGLGVKRAYWHSFKDLDTPGQADPWTGRMGLLTLKGKRRPAWYAYARVAGGRP